ncbi:hypothetical protein [Paenibacillus oleatilyticus]|uniref:Uncharacterized protein n=1 Tax=Paenibacillus oleatilyticus TaxID=2594886 RepID=A0ABV4VA56_9BACL
MKNLFHCLDLSDTLNHRACATKNGNERAYLTLSGSAIPEEYIPFNQAFQFDTIPFIMFKNDIWDNIEMVGQRVYFSTVRASSIHFIGTSTETDMTDNVILELDEQPVYSTSLNLRYFASDPEPVFMNNRCVIQAPYIYSGTKINSIVKPSLWYTCISIQEPLEINSVVLADNPCMHIFSITVERQEGTGV